MASLQSPLLRTLLLLLSGATLLASGCVDPEGKFTEFDKRVFDAGMPAVGTGCVGGVIPDVSGEFYLNLSTPLGPDSYLEFIFTQTIDINVNPAVLAMSLQPLCVQAEQCTVGSPVGDMLTLDNTTVDENCDFELDIVGVPIPGGANALSGSDLIGNLLMKGNLQGPDFYCGLVDGSAEVGGAPVPINGSTFGSVRNTAVGALGDDLPDAVAFCPPAT